MAVKLAYIPYYGRTDYDQRYFEEFLRGRLPEDIYDVHVHLNLPEHVRDVPRERILSDWALECAQVLTCDDAYRLADELFPGCRYRIAGFPWPIREADIKGNNDYLSGMQRAGKVDPFMAVRPEWDAGEVERTLLQGKFVGFKPYPDMVSGRKGADIGIFDFFPRKQWELLERHRRAVMLHLPRKQRLADPQNIQELLEARQSFPQVTIIVAHLGRSFCPYYLDRGLSQLGSVEGLLFDLSGVMNPAVLDIAFDRIPPTNILFGSDMPIFLWHGRREWTEREYINLAREEFTWSRNHRSAEEERTYTFFLYEQLRNILDAMERQSLGDAQKRGVFGGNARRVLGLDAM
jgi:predicted TIM-barrel fold metal-dependent hydrolase